MSYDLFCYKSKLGRPDVEEAQRLLEKDDVPASETDPSVEDEKEKIVNALLDYDPMLERFEFDYAEIAKQHKITEDEARRRTTHTELHKTEDKFAILLTIADHTAYIAVPYWHSEEDSKAAFDEVAAYAKIIRQTCGYFVYDTQTEKVYDPLTDNFELSVYENIVDATREFKTKLLAAPKKAWWKFW